MFTRAQQQRRHPFADRRPADDEHQGRDTAARGTSSAASAQTFGESEAFQTEVLEHIINEFGIHQLNRRSARIPLTAVPEHQSFQLLRGSREDVQRNVDELNRLLEATYGGMLRQREWSASAAALLDLEENDAGVMVLKLAPDWCAELVRTKNKLRDVLSSRPATHPSDSPWRRFGWYWQPLASRFSTIKKFKMDLKVLSKKLKPLVPFNAYSFPADDIRLKKDLKVHLQYHLRKNAEGCLENIAWFGDLPEDGVGEPMYIMFNTGLVSRSDRKAYILIMMAPNTKDPESPWFGLRVLLSSQLSCPHVMRDHLHDREQMRFTDMQCLLVSEQSTPMVPAIMEVDDREMLFNRKS